MTECCCSSDSCPGSDRQSDAECPPDLPGPRTDEIYRTVNLPTRFLHPKVFKGYRQLEGKSPHPGYRSTSTDYGWFSPTIHTVPTSYYPRNCAFSSVASRGGMWRNCSLNTELDKPDLRP